MKKISIFLICSLLMIFGLSFSACADAVTTGGVTATAVAPRAVDSSGNIIDVSENINHVEHTAFAKANATTTETTTTKPAYNQEEMKKDLEDLGKEDMAASAVGIFAWVKGLVDWTQGIINTLGIYIKAGIDSPWGFDLNGFVDLFAPFFKTIGYGILVLLFGINLIHSAMQFELVNYKGVIKILVGLLLAKLWVDLSTDICIALIDTCTDIASSVSRLEKNHKKGLNFVPYHWTERERELEDLQERLSDTNCELFKIGVFISLSASTKEELEELTEAIRSKGKKHQVVIDCLVRQQEKALDSVLPFGINHFDNANGNNVNTYVLSDAAGILIPFSARSYFSDTGLCYGMNKHTNAIIVLDRAEEMNANGFYLGTSGSGKSMYCKSEIIDTIIRYPKSEKIIIDPDGEYYPLIKRFGGDTLKLSADSETKINIFDTDINISENGTSAVAMKSELIMSIIETARGLPLSAADKSIIDSCVKEVYADYVLNNGNPEFTPTFVDFYNALINKKLPEADQIALDIELYVNGSFNTFSGKTNIHTDNKLLSIDISDMGEQLRPVGLQVILEYIWQRVRDNRNKGIQTWVWVDEFSVMFNDGNGKETVRSADFFQKVFKRIRKYGGIPTGITQNITEVLDSGQAKVMLSNSEFVVLLQQKKTDLDKLIELFNLSPSQSSYLQTGEKGTGLIVSGRKIIPFDRCVPKDSAIYKLCQTDFRREI